MIRTITLALATLASALPPQTGSFDRWLSHGYGLLVERDGDELRLFEHRALGDLPWAHLQRLPGEPERYGGQFEGEPLELELRERADGVLLLDWGVSSHPLALHPTELDVRIPSEAQRRDPFFNFDWFCASYDEHYAFFETRGIDWRARTAAARERLSKDSTELELFELLGDLIAPLHDGHCSLSGAGGFRSTDLPDPDPEGSRRLQACRALVDRNYLDGEQRALNDRLTWGPLIGGVTYLRLDAMEGLAPGGHDEGLAALRTQLVEVFSGIQDGAGLIVDVRFNGGGSDLYGFALAAHLLAQERVVVHKEVLDTSTGARDTWRQGEFRVLPAEPGFRGPVALLVSRHTASAAEVFGMALLARESGVRIIGEQSASIFSDMHPSTLPNGWSLTLSNEIYRLPDGRCFEGIGLPLDVELPTVRAQDLERGEDPALEAAVDWILSH